MAVLRPHEREKPICGNLAGWSSEEGRPFQANGSRHTVARIREKVEAQLRTQLKRLPRAMSVQSGWNAPALA
jgi:hypothetical protein